MRLEWPEEEQDRQIPIWRNGYLSQWDDWVSTDSWSGDKIILRSSDPHMHVRVKVRVWGKRGKDRRLRPARWHALLEVAHFSQEIGRGRCKSLLGASKAVLALDLSKLTNELLGAFYAQQRATCVYVEADRPTKWSILMGRRCFEPFCTAFGPYPDYMHFPSGHIYLVVKPGTDSTHLVDRRSWHGYSSTSNPEIRAEGAELQHWVRPGVDQSHAHPVPI